MKIVKIDSCKILKLVQSDHVIFLDICCLGVLGVTHEFLENFQKLILYISFVKLGFRVFLLMEKRKSFLEYLVGGILGSGSLHVIVSKV
jgi:hypothetical protein